MAPTGYFNYPFLSRVDLRIGKWHYLVTAHLEGSNKLGKRGGLTHMRAFSEAKSNTLLNRDGDQIPGFQFLREIQVFLDLSSLRRSHPPQGVLWGCVLIVGRLARCIWCTVSTQRYSRDTQREGLLSCIIRWKTVIAAIPQVSLNTIPHVPYIYLCTQISLSLTCVHKDLKKPGSWGICSLVGYSIWAFN